MSVDKTVGLSTNNMDVKNKFSHDVKKLTNAAAKLKITSKRKADKEKEKISNNSTRDVQQQQKQVEEEKTIVSTAVVENRVERTSSKKEFIIDSKPIRTRPSTEQVVAKQQEKRWTLTDLLHCLGTYVHQQCKGLISRPTAPEVAMWIRCTDKALHLNGWTINSFLYESHLVFTYMLLQRAFEKFEVRTLTDAKELVLMCLYISYTYNANEISYPLRPFLVKHDRIAFWNKCTDISLDSSRDMLNINRDRSFYKEILQDLRSYSITYTSYTYRQ